MARETAFAYLARRLERRADEIAPPTTDDDLLREAAAKGPAHFAREILGVSLAKRQREIVESVLTFKRLACKSNHKSGKSLALACLALWFYIRFPRSRIVITAPTYRQVQEIIWAEITRLVRNARVPIPGGKEIAALAANGLTHPSTDARIRGYTADQKEAIAGTSGPAILYLVDEASGVAPGIFEAIEGNRAGGNAWLYLISNPTRADGEFYEAFHQGKRSEENPHGYHAISITAHESPNVTGEWRELDYWDAEAKEWRNYPEPPPGEPAIPGLAHQGWITERAAVWGKTDPRYLQRVEASFAIAEEAKVCPAGLLFEAQERWLEKLPPSYVAPLTIGVDPAGSGRDPSAFAARRGGYVREVYEERRLTAAEHVDHVLALIARHGAEGEIPRVVVDSDGEVGADVYGAFRSHLSQRPGAFKLVRFRGGEKPQAPQKARIFGTTRDLLYASCRDWLREGGAIPPNAELERQLHAPEFRPDNRGRSKLTPKDGKGGLRELLGRSPDLADAVALSCWEQGGSDNGGRGDAPGGAGGERTFDAYAGEGRADHSKTFDPYGGSRDGKERMDRVAALANAHRARRAPDDSHGGSAVRLAEVRPLRPRRLEKRGDPQSYARGVRNGRGRLAA